MNKNPPPAGIENVLRRMVAEREARIGFAAAATAKAHARQLMERERIIAERDSMLAERESRIEKLDRMVAERDRTIEARDDEIGRLRPEAVKLARLAVDLAWEDGPRSLRMVLPLAELIRKLTGN